MHPANFASRPALTNLFIELVDVSVWPEACSKIGCEHAIESWAKTPWITRYTSGYRVR